MPTNVDQLRSFLGLAGYYRKFRHDFSPKANTLFKLLKKGVTFRWNNECQDSFNYLKDALVFSPVLVYPDFSKRFILQTDASTKGLGAILTQEVDGTDYLIVFASRGLKQAEKNYPSFELEALSGHFDNFVHTYIITKL